MDVLQNFRNPALYVDARSFLSKKKVKTAMNVAIIILVTYILANKLNQIGLENIVSALPSTSIFYFLSVLLFLTPVISEALVYSILTKKSRFDQFGIFIRKQVYNEALFSYAGEFFLTERLSHINKMGLKRAAILVKDAALIRTFVANFWILTLLALTFIIDKQDFLAAMKGLSPIVTVAAILLSIAPIGILVLFFRKFSKLSLSNSAKITSAYLTRSFIIAILQIAQWSIILPAVSLKTWLLILITYALAKKSPVGGDLVFIAAVLSIPGFIGDENTLAAVLIATVAAIQLIYLSVFVTVSASELFEKSKRKNSALHKPVEA